MNQILNWHVKIYEPNILDQLVGVDKINLKFEGRCLVAYKAVGARGISLMPFKKKLLQFQLPRKLVRYRKNCVDVTRQLIDNNEGELFRIKPIDFEFISRAVPHVSKTYFYIPHRYINEYLDERAGRLMVSFARNTSDAIKKLKCLNIILTEQTLPLSCRLVHAKNGLRCRITPAVHAYLNGSGVLLEEFIYNKTTPPTLIDKYGVIVFEELSDG